MAINKKLRQQVKNKFNGLCAYTGKPLDDKWQVDHVLPKVLNNWLKSGYVKEGCEPLESIDCIANLLPAIRIVNHYKRSLDLDGFRGYMQTFHIRLDKLPKKTSLESTRKRIAYMNEVANLFDITPSNPFGGKFYFETLNCDIIKPSEKEEIRKAVLKDLEQHEKVKKEGFAGILPGGHIVDRRIHPEAIPMQENKMLGIPKPSKI